VEPHLNSLPDGSSDVTTKTSRILTLLSTPSCLNDWLFSAISWHMKISWTSYFQERAVELSVNTGSYSSATPFIKLET
jgi:hypothetical protein